MLWSGPATYPSSDIAKLCTRSFGIALGLVGRSLEPGSTILVGKGTSGEEGDAGEVDITIIPGEVTPEKVTVPPDEPVASSDEPSEEE